MMRLLCTKIPRYALHIQYLPNRVVGATVSHTLLLILPCTVPLCVLASLIMSDNEMCSLIRLSSAYDD